MSTEKLTTPTTTDNGLSTSIKWYENSNFCWIVKNSGLNQKSATCTALKILSFFIAHKLDAWSQDLNSDFASRDCLFGGVKLDKNANHDKYVYSHLVRFVFRIFITWH